ncbi:DUF2231 domain-containing protein [Melioribacteraceae bacterium 4301-Me]|uniref:DUF2231 domain-containing protein n=1 Tax=Pyranulibacter aquaticus TaxID=3163344 RepID=UPI0035976544
MEFLSYLHPRIVHFPIAIFVVYFLFEAFAAFLKKDFLNKSAYILLALGVIFSVAAVLTGNQAQELLKEKFPSTYKTISSLIQKHNNYATLTLWYFLSLMIFRTYLVLKKKFLGWTKYLVVFLALLGVLFIILTALYGGDLVYYYGAGTSRFGTI